MIETQYKKVKPAVVKDAEYRDYIDLSKEQKKTDDSNDTNIITCPGCKSIIRNHSILTSFFYCQCCGIRLYYDGNRAWETYDEDTYKSESNTYDKRRKKKEKLDIEIAKLKEQYKYEKLRGKYEIEKRRNENFQNSDIDWKTKRSMIKWTFYIVLLIVVGIFMIYSSINSKLENRKSEKRINEMISQGKISAGYYNDYQGKNYYSVVSDLKELGFSNIELRDLNDTDPFTEFLFDDMKENTIATISIAGKSYFTEKDFFNPDDKILICYH